MLEEQRSREEEVEACVDEPRSLLSCAPAVLLAAANPSPQILRKKRVGAFSFLLTVLLAEINPFSQVEEGSLAEAKKKFEWPP